MKRVAVIDYGMGNLRSVVKALGHVRPDVTVRATDDPEFIGSADHIVFPGVGALRDCMAEIRRRGLDTLINDCAHSKPFLGICLGMQALLEYSEENGGTAGLGIIQGRVVGFATPLIDTSHDVRLKVPHMGWNEVHQTHSHPLWTGIPEHERFYFVHSYYAMPVVPSDVAGTCRYGQEFVAALGRENVFAVQFHPEKSQQAGLMLLSNFIAWDGRV
jgi:imidazole glycerol-phosphate synthase subunit HisH